MPTAEMVRAREAIDAYGNVKGGVSHHPQPGGRARGLYDPKASYFAMAMR